MCICSYNIYAPCEHAYICTHIYVYTYTHVHGTRHTRVHAHARIKVKPPFVIIHTPQHALACRGSLPESHGPFDMDVDRDMASIQREVGETGLTDEDLLRVLECLARLLNMSLESLLMLVFGTWVAGMPASAPVYNHQLFNEAHGETVGPEYIFNVGPFFFFPFFFFRSATAALDTKDTHTHTHSLLDSYTCARGKKKTLRE